MVRILVMGGLAESLVNFRGALLREMVGRGNEVFACAPDASAKVRGALSEMNVVYRYVDLNRTGINPIQDLESMKSLVALFRDIKPDVLLSYTIKPVVYGSIAARLTGIPNVFSMITGLGYVFSGQTLQDRFVGRLATALYRFALRYNKRVFFQNPDDLNLFLQRNLVQSTEQAVLISGSGVDVSAFQPVSYSSKISFLMIARLLRDKGVYEYVEAARRLSERYPDVQFRLAGWIDSNPSSIDPGDLQSWQEEGVIDYLGRLDDVRPAIEDCAVYVLPSYREGTPRTVLEAMAMGRPVITTDVPGCRETVRDGENGFLVPARDVTHLARAMERFVTRPELIERMGQIGRSIAVEKYDVHKVNAVILGAMGLV